MTGLFIRRIEYMNVTMDFPLENEDGSFDPIDESELYKTTDDLVVFLTSGYPKNIKRTVREIAHLVWYANDGTVYFLEEMTL